MIAASGSASGGKHETVERSDNLGWATSHPVALGGTAVSKNSNVESPGTFELTSDQKALLRSLTFLSRSELEHTPKAAGDVLSAFTANVLSAIASSGVLGGQDRVDELTPLIDQYAKLQAIEKVLEPMNRLVSQNLLKVGAQLSTHVSEVVKTAASNKTKPQLLEGVKDAQDWQKKYHPGRAAKPKPDEKK